MPGNDERPVTEALIAGQIHGARAAGIATMLALPWNEPLEEVYIDLGYRSRRSWLEFEGPLPA